MNIKQSLHFGRQKKKLNANQIQDLDEAISELMKNPDKGEQKRGDLSPIRVYKFRMTSQLCLLAYSHSQELNQIVLHAVGPHENFYRDLKRNID